MTSGSFDAQAVSDFLSVTLAACGEAWNDQAIRRLSARQVPDEIYGLHRWLLEGDIRLTWVNWYVESLVDKGTYSRNHKLEYAHLYGDLKSELRSRYRSAPEDELNTAASRVADIAWSDISSMRAAGRLHIPRSIREDLWFAAEPRPSCYLCGYAFEPLARDKYLLRNAAATVGRPLLVDVTRPRGIKPRDLQVEVDHVIPVTAGGETTISNLRLACGWCNSVKSDRRSIYDSSAVSSITVATKELGLVRVPQPMWVLRVVATRARCEAPEGCSARLETHELFIAPRNPRGALNPVNAFVCCRDHDPWATSRFIGVDTFTARPTR